MKLFLSKRLFYNYPQRLFLLKDINKVRNYTVVPPPSLIQMWEIIQKAPEGDIVETGCRRGGCGALMAKWSKRKVHLFDSFEPLPDSKYDQKKIEKARRNKIGTDDYGMAVKIAKKLGVLDLIMFYKGWFKDTIPKAKIDRIAILRLDSDTYESTKYSLEQLYDKVVEGGYIVIDDWHGWRGCRIAIYEFCYENKIYPFIQKHPFRGRSYFIKNTYYE